MPQASSLSRSRPLIGSIPPTACNPLDDYLALCKEACDGEINRLYGPDERGSNGLYDLILDYPLRGGKALRPALSIATCLGLGGHLEAVLPTAATLELFMGRNYIAPRARWPYSTTLTSLAGSVR